MHYSLLDETMEFFYPFYQIFMFLESLSYFFSLFILFRFTEIYVDEITDINDLKTLVAYYLKNMNLSSNVIDGIVRLVNKFSHNIILKNVHGGEN